ncbi:MULTISPECIES: non-ribosomal peptide synthetase [Streptomyces]|uniref:Non-ribosomal peptide synthetase n=1 Tax=Streptomyces doudnae TaxID=3075536 RepID=A0ABD5ELF1_9ACTN|nr:MULTISPECIES: non-ribosomal peptide synthetase [unclassified Streptomyces]MDT0435476.1 non-ribosomal peptide synthetase [Streptomyces sp. DSM 41981]SCD63968.1 amino acid adenylation domain-containing protein [Streptomyces sp. SolWspMP-5a-2]
MESGQRTLVELFEETAARFPDRVAVTADDGDLTYRELDLRSAAVAGRLREAGAGPGSLVGLLVPRTGALAVGLLGIVRSGAGYVPVDPEYPEERIAWTLEDTDVTALVTTTALAKRFTGSVPDLVVLSEDERADGKATPAPPGETAATRRTPPAPDDLAYVIHTSGSTGLPKGVQVEHRQVVRLFDVTRDLFGFDEHDVWTLFHSVAFDFSVWEFWGPLLTGGRLVVVPRAVARVPADLLRLLRAERVTVLNQTPSAFARLAAAGVPPLADLRWVVFGGERLEPGSLRGWFDRHGDTRPRLVTMYGITEATVHASFRPLTAADCARPGSPIGRPLADLAFQVLDEDGGAVADGTPGELYLSGAGLARGYLNRPALEKERFLELPGPDGTVRRCYRTGDRVVALPDGGYGYLGRTDDQLKIRGHRVEPGEIEAVLLADPAVSAAVAVARDHGEDDVRILAYVASDAPAADLAPRLGERAAAVLPAHMRPSGYVVLPELPLTRNGKTDRRGLPDPAAALAPVAVTAPEAGVTPTEARIAGIWREVLDLPDVGRDTDFFDLGGTSLSLLRMFAETNDAFGTDLDITVLIDGATVATLARHIDTALATP